MAQFLENLGDLPRVQDTVEVIASRLEVVPGERRLAPRRRRPELARFRATMKSRPARPIWFKRA
ncbi:hypothetical protein JOF29_000108 [Kribbella aluminosa]|uniref:Uncharacterized protein n=1 Tax=Kribbella aluminosa TaxID=416017 RepID=A0ABS4UBM5_9ACTN|nr:hypothetical protein [Kribbella aluminosa]MBP2349025.1 hypothetical protein [Kribbella aluminosa]